MTGFQSKRAMANDKLAGVEDKLFEHEIVTTVRIKFRTTEELSLDRMLEEYGYVTNFSDVLVYNQPDGFPRVVEVAVLDDQVQSYNKVIEGELL